MAGERNRFIRKSAGALDGPLSFYAVQIENGNRQGSYEYVAGDLRGIPRGYLDRPTKPEFRKIFPRGANRRERKIAQNFARRDIAVRFGDDTRVNV